MAGAQFIDFVAALPTDSPHLERPQWSRQIEKSYDAYQSSAVIQSSDLNDRRWP
jgi:hypothetical protein